MELIHNARWRTFGLSDLPKVSQLSGHTLELKTVPQCPLRYFHHALCNSAFLDPASFSHMEAMEDCL